MFWEYSYDESQIPKEARYFVVTYPNNGDGVAFLTAEEPRIVNERMLICSPLSDVPAEDEEEDDVLNGEGSEEVHIANVPFVVEKLPQRFFGWDAHVVSPGQTPLVPHFSPGGNQTQIPPPPPAP